MACVPSEPASSRDPSHQETERPTSRVRRLRGVGLLALLVLLSLGPAACSDISAPPFPEPEIEEPEPTEPPEDG